MRKWCEERRRNEKITWGRWENEIFKWEKIDMIWGKYQNMSTEIYRENENIKWGKMRESENYIYRGRK